MKKIFTLIVALAAIVQTTKAQAPHGPMTFVGKANFYVSMGGSKAGETFVPSDSLIYEGADFTLPDIDYNGLVVPSFTIKNTKFTGGYGKVTWEDQTFTSTVKDESGEEKTVTGSSLKGEYTLSNGIHKLVLEVTFSYGKMPFPVTYHIESYYVKGYSGENQVTVGGQYGPYKANVTQKIRTYIEDEVTKMDVEIPTYTLENTAIGNLTLGTYTVKGLTYDESKGGYYKDYAADGLVMHFKAEKGGAVTMDDDYPLSTEGQENILVVIADGKAKITNNFQAGKMPFPISAVMDQNGTTAIRLMNAENTQAEEAIYNLKGQRVTTGTRGIVIKNGKKIFVK